MTAKPTGVQIMAASLIEGAGLGPVIAAARELASNGSIQRIVAFADAAEGIGREVRALADRLDGLEASLAAIGARLGLAPCDDRGPGLGAGPGSAAGPDTGPGGADPGERRAA
jgi:hypothetical protein